MSFCFSIYTRHNPQKCLGLSMNALTSKVQQFKLMRTIFWAMLIFSILLVDAFIPLVGSFSWTTQLNFWWCWNCYPYWKQSRCGQPDKSERSTLGGELRELILDKLLFLHVLYGFSSHVIFYPVFEYWKQLTVSFRSCRNDLLTYTIFRIHFWSINFTPPPFLKVWEFSIWLII